MVGSPDPSCENSERRGIVRVRIKVREGFTRARAAVNRAQLARKYAAVGRTAEAFDHLERALEERAPWLVYIHGYAQFENLRDDPRFAAIVRRIGAPASDDEAVARIMASVRHPRS